MSTYRLTTAERHGAPMADTLATCWSCGTVRPLDEMLVVRDRLEPDKAPWYCCRASSIGGPGDCLRLAAGPAARYPIALAQPPEANR